MTFDPLKFYEDGQRKQKRYDSLFPVFLVAVVLLVAFYGFFVAYQRSHWKPKPVAEPKSAAAAPVVRANNDCVRHGDGWECGDLSTHWMNCDAGMEVADYRDCPEFKTAYARAYAVLARKLEPQRTRKHKRKTDIYSLCRTNHGTVSQCRAEADYLAGKTSGTLTSGFIPVSSGNTWIADAPLITEVDHKTKYVFEDCDPVSSAQIGRYSDIIVTCSGHEVQLIWRDGPHESTPADITRLMEQIAPTPLKQADGTCVIVDEWKDASNNQRQSLTPVRCPESPKTEKPDCKMPADIDVCPIQMLDPKGADDKKGKP